MKLSGIPTFTFIVSLTHRMDNAPINVNPREGGGEVRARGGDLMPDPPVGLLIVRSDPRSGHLTLTDKSLASIQKRLPSPSLEAF